MAQTIEKRLIAVVEGKDEAGFFPSLIQSRGLPDFQVMVYEGKPNLRGFLKGLRNAAGFSSVEALAVFRDADADPAAAAQAMRDALTAARLPSPPAPMAVKNGTPRTIICVVPGANQIGELEDACNAAIAEDARYPAYTAFLADFQLRTNNSISRMAKTLTQVHLACQTPYPIGRIGEGARAGAWQLEHSAFDHLAEALEMVAVGGQAVGANP